MLISSTTFEDRSIDELILLNASLRAFPILVSRKISRVPCRLNVEKYFMQYNNTDTLTLLHMTRNMLRMMYLNTS